MMAVTLTDLVQYLLPYRQPGGGGPICRQGYIQTTIPVFPPMEIAYDLAPEFGSFATIYYHIEFSSEIVPGAFDMIFTHSGVVVAAGRIGEMVIRAGWSVWVPITESDIAHQTLTNVSGIGQFMEAISMFLIVNSEEEYNKLLELARNYGMGPNMGKGR
jgi:hypothetical protein